MTHDQRVNADNLKLREVYEESVKNGDTPRAVWSLKQLNKRGILYVKKC